MSYSYTKKIALIGGGVAFSAVLTLLEEQLSNMHTPGTYVAGELFNGPATNIALAGFVWLGVDFVLWFVVLSGTYLLFTKLFKWRKNDPS